MIFGHFRLNVIEANAFILACPENREALIVDCGEFDPCLIQFVENEDLAITTIFVTHEHYDHVGGVGEAAKHFDAQVIAGTPAPGEHLADRVVGHGDEIAIGHLVGRVVETSGHTPVGLSLVFDDALFAGSVGGTSNDEDYERQRAFIRENLFTLPDDYEVHVGHGPSTTIGIEKRYNPFFV